MNTEVTSATDCYAIELARHLEQLNDERRKELHLAAALARYSRTLGNAGIPGEEVVFWTDYLSETVATARKMGGVAAGMSY